MAPLKIIGAGYGRTGTDSLRTALNMLGYKTHHMKSFREDPNLDPDEFYEGYQHPEQADWTTIYRDYDAAVDWPTAAYWKPLFQQFPDAKVILTVRTPESWYKSVRNTIGKYQGQHMDLTPNHPRYKFARMAKAVCLEGQLADPTVTEETLCQFFLNNIEQVKQTVPSNQLLVMELGEGWARLCEFLDKPIPNEPYPNVNSTAEHQRYVLDRK
ncbi:P-loop containing nucleoside triphosphate hydrolase protein, partial [Gilbertella persicaria]|uniref:P-loop containing nucleoside triphosphate hydrolase protein n=1 Tax=Gilbertella persicaria TaxID=101096 RepID=UPI00221F1001